MKVFGLERYKRYTHANSYHYTLKESLELEKLKKNRDESVMISAKILFMI